MGNTLGKSQMVQVKPIRSDADYEEAVAEIGALMNAKPNTAEFDRLDVLATLAEAYEKREHPLPKPDPIAALEYEMEKRGLTRADLGRILGAPKGRVSEILNRRRPLTLRMIRNAQAGLGVSGDLLLAVYPLVSPK